MQQKNSLINKCDALEHKIEEINNNQNTLNENTMLQNKLKEYEERINSIQNNENFRNKK